MNDKFYEISDGAHCLIFLKKKDYEKDDDLVSSNDFRNILRASFINQRGYIIFYTKTQNPETCLATVSKYAGALRFVKNQTTEICLAAVKQNGYTLQYVKVQTPEVCLAAINNNPLAIEYVKKLTYELCLNAVQKNVIALKLIKNRAIKAAVKKAIIVAKV